jgi:hypothetical protein
MNSGPFRDTALARFLQKRVLELRPKKTQVQISLDAGYAQPNMVALLKRGDTKLAIDRVPGLARALETDPAHLMPLALEQAHGSTTAQALIEIFGTAVTRNELAWLNEIREASGHVDPSLTARARTAIRGIFGK